MGRSDLSLRAQFRKLWEISFLQRLIFLLTDRIWSHSPDFRRQKQGHQNFLPPFHIQGVPEKVPFWNFRSTNPYDYSGPLCTLVRECNGPFRYFGQLWTVGPFHTILFGWLARNCHMDLWTQNFRKVLYNYTGTQCMLLPVKCINPYLTQQSV